MNSQTSKIIVLGAAVVASAAAFGYFFNSFLVTENAALLIWSLIGAAIFLIVFPIAAMLIDATRRMFLIIGLAVIGMSVWFLVNYAGLPLLAGTAILILILFNAYRAAVFEMNNSFKIKFMKIARPIANQAASGLAILALLLYFGSLDFKDASSFFFNLTEKSVMTAESLLPSEFQKNLTPALKEQLRSETINQIYNLTFGKLLSLSKVQQNLILLGVGAATFLTLRGTVFLLNWLIVWIGAGIFRILHSARFFRIALESKSQEVVKLE